MKIINYRIFRDNCYISLQKYINELIEHHRYQPFGNLREVNGYYSQVMVQYEDEKESFDKQFAEQITDLKKDIDEKLTDVAREECWRENEMLRKILLKIIKGNVKYYKSHGYCLSIAGEENYSKTPESHENFHIEILEGILEHKKRVGIWKQ